MLFRSGRPAADRLSAVSASIRPVLYAGGNQVIERIVRTGKIIQRQKDKVTTEWKYLIEGDKKEAHWRGPIQGCQTMVTQTSPQGSDCRILEKVRRFPNSGRR